MYMNDGCIAAGVLPNIVFLLPVGSVSVVECDAKHGLHLYKTEFDIYHAMGWSDVRRVRRRS